MTTVPAPESLRPGEASTDGADATGGAVPSSTAAAAAPPPPLHPPPPTTRPPPYTRFIALQVFYLGWGYTGFTSQGRPDDGTAEAALLAALRRTGLIPRLGEGGGKNGGAAGTSASAAASASSSFFPPEFTRCGRTDKGVSGMGQVVALRVRSRLGPDGVREAGAAAPAPTAAQAAAADPDAEEIDYVRTLNGSLPPTIRVTAWAPAPPGFSARFSAAWRRYRYFLVEDTHAPTANPATPGGRLDVAAMRAAAAHLVGAHDFRNFCRADIPAVTNFRRTIKSLTIERIGEDGEDGGGGGGGDGGGGGTGTGGAGPAGATPPPLTALPGAPPVPPLRLPAGLVPPGQDGVVVTLTGAAFLWHQVRCIVSILAMVGRGLESPGIVAAMLDTGPGGAFPAKPQYVMAPERPLLFCGAGFCGGDLAWRRGGRGAGSGSGSGGCEASAAGSALAGVRELLREQVAGTLLLAAVVAQLEAEAADDGDGGAAAAEAAAAAVGDRPPHPHHPPPPKRRAPRRHKPLATRPCDPPLEDRLAAKGLAIVEGDPTRPVACGVDGMAIVESPRRGGGTR